MAGRIISEETIEYTDKLNANHVVHYLVCAVYLALLGREFHAVTVSHTYKKRFCSAPSKVVYVVLSDFIYDALAVQVCKIIFYCLR